MDKNVIIASVIAGMVIVGGGIAVVSSNARANKAEDAMMQMKEDAAMMKKESSDAMIKKEAPDESDVMTKTDMAPAP